MFRNLEPIDNILLEYGFKLFEFNFNFFISYYHNMNFPVTLAFSFGKGNYITRMYHTYNKTGFYFLN